MEIANSHIQSFVEQYAASSFNRPVLVGFANIAEIPNIAVSQAPFDQAVVIALALNAHAIARLNEDASLYTQEYQRCLGFVHDLEDMLCDDLKRQGYSSVSLATVRNQTLKGGSAALRSCDGTADTLTSSFGLSQRMIAAHAGLGWIGKSGLVITKHFGAAVLLGTVFTDAPLECSSEVFLSRCGRCMECVANCPNDAITNFEYASEEDGPKFVEFLCAENESVNATDQQSEGTGVCGMCIFSCPYTRAYLHRQGCSFA